VRELEDYKQAAGAEAEMADEFRGRAVRAEDEVKQLRGELQEANEALDADWDIRIDEEQAKNERLRARLEAREDSDIVVECEPHTRARVEELKGQVSELEEQVERLKADRDLAWRVVKENRVTIERLREQSDALNRGLGVAIDEAEKLRAELKGKEHARQIQETEIIQLRAAERQSEGEIERRMVKIDELCVEVERLQAEHDDTDEMLAYEQAENTRLRAQLESEREMTTHWHELAQAEYAEKCDEVERLRTAIAKALDCITEDDMVEVLRRTLVWENEGGRS
jgi:chromosome segregation ATPase